MAATWQGGGAGLVVLEDDRRTFSHLTLRRSRILARSTGDVRAAAGCRARPIFAFIEAGGSVVVCDVFSGTVILRIQPSEGA